MKNKQKDEDEEIRLKLLKDYDLKETDLKKNFSPGTFGCHELMHTISVMERTWDENVLEHSSCIMNKKWFKKAAKITEKMYQLYNDVATAHLSDESEK